MLSRINVELIELLKYIQKIIAHEIFFLGDDQHIGGREQFRTTPPDLDLANARAPANYVPLSTPPRVLTIDDSFPSIQPSGEEVKEAGQGEPRDATTIHGRHDQSLLNGLLTMDTSYRRFVIEFLNIIKFNLCVQFNNFMKSGFLFSM